MTQNILLNGCAPTPLAHYLKALGILRLVAEQKDPEATGCWRNEGFVLNSVLDEEALLQFFLEEYRPTPIIAPWNGGSGFYIDDKKNRTALLKIRDSSGDRFINFRKTIEMAESVLSKMQLSQKPDDRDKDVLLIALRANLPDEALVWLDAAMLLTSEGRKAIPLLGKGGNEGRLEFSNNFLQKVALVIDVNTSKPSDKSRLWMNSVLFGHAIAGLEKGSPGMLLPFASGGPNATNGFEADAKSTAFINPWDYVLMLEGAVVFASSATRRLESSAGSSIAFSFMVKADGAGQGGLAFTDANQAHNEIWLPLWDRASNFMDVRALFAEGRATINKRNAVTGLDFSRAISTLGINRGINEFVRVGFLERRAPGQGYYVTAPLGRFLVRKNPNSELIQELEKNNFLNNIRTFAKTKEAPGRIVSLVHQLENCLFELTRSSNPKTVQDILILLGKLQRTLSISAKGFEAVRPVPLLSVAWLMNADDETAEFRLACALAGLSAVDLPMRFHFARIKADKKSRFYNEIWDKESRLAVWGEGSFESNMTTLLRTRLLAAERLQHKDKPFNFGFGADCSDIACFLEAATDDRSIGELAQGLALLKDISRNSAGRKDQQTVLPGAYVALKPFFTTDKVLQKIDFLPPDCKLPFRAEILASLAANQTDKTDKAVKLAWDKLKQAGVPLPLSPKQPPSALAMDGPRLLAALAIPVEFLQLKKMLLGIMRHQKQSN